MNAATCSALTSVFPLLLITAMLERPRIRIKLRRTHWYRNYFVVGSLGVNILGLVLTVIGIQAGGLISGWAITAWVLFGVSVTGFLLSLMMIGVSDELDEDEITQIS